MEQRQQRMLDSLRRVQDFLNAHADVVAALSESEGRKQLDAAVAALTTHTGGQASITLDIAGQLSRQRALEADLRTKHMQPIASFARAKLRGTPDFAALTRSGAKLHRAELVRAARAMATAAAPQAAVFAAAGFPADIVAQLGAAASTLEDAMTARANARVSRVGATKGIHEELMKGREAVLMLNAVLSKQFADDAPFLAAWRAAHRITAKPGVVRVSTLPVGTVVPVVPVAATTSAVPVSAVA